MSLVSMLTEQLKVNRDIPRHECLRPFVFRLRMNSTHKKQKINMEGIFAVMNTTQAVVKIRPERKIQACTGFESQTSAIPVQCSAN